MQHEFVVMQHYQIAIKQSKNRKLSVICKECKHTSLVSDQWNELKEKHKNLVISENKRIRRKTIEFYLYKLKVCTVSFYWINTNYFSFPKMLNPVWRYLQYPGSTFHTCMNMEPPVHRVSSKVYFSKENLTKSCLMKFTVYRIVLPILVWVGTSQYK